MSEHDLINCTDPNCWCVDFRFRKEIALDEEDMVNHPSHYRIKLEEGQEIEALSVIKATLTVEEFKGYLVGNMIKYILRHKKKNKDEDLKKLCFYSEELKEIM